MNVKLVQGLLFCSVCSCAVFCAAGVASLVASFFQAHSPSSDDHEDESGVGVEDLPSSIFGSSGAGTSWGDGGEMAFAAIGLRP